MEEQIRDTEVYAEIIKLRPILKAIQQISWEVNMLEKRFPIGEVSPEGLGDILAMYQELVGRARKELTANG